MTQMDVLRADLEKAKGYWTALAEQTGIQHSTIARIASGRTPNPQIDTYQKIRDWLDEKLPMIEALAPGAPMQQHAAYHGPDRRHQMRG